MKPSFSLFCLRRRAMASQIIAYQEGRLDDGARSRVEAHLRVCASCRAEAEAVAEMRDLLSAHVSRTASENAPAASGDLWSRIEADIRRSGTIEQRQAAALRRRRAVPFFGDGWGSSVSIAASIFAAAVFSMALANMHPAGRVGGADAGAASGIARVDDRPAISLTFRPSPVPLFTPSGNVAFAQAGQTSHSRASTTLRIITTRRASWAVAERSHPRLAVRARRHAPQGFSVPTLEARPNLIAAEQGGDVRIAALSKPFAKRSSATTLAFSLQGQPAPANPSANNSVAATEAAEPATASATTATAAAGALASAQTAAKTSADAKSDGVAVHDVPASVSVADLAAPLRLQQGLFSYAQR